ncbi:MAG: alpha/beta hydrolase [Candidatus Saccharibacteria bacterium]|nr:alpha/beta hydrolase [Candidatus Saccharibacteria bacterium]
MSKPTVFLVHGFNGIPKIFNYFKRVFEEEGYKVVMPSFPIRTNITIESYFEVFDRYRKDLNDNTIVIAHSIGNIMILKYLSKCGIRICGYISLAGFGEPFVNEGRDDLNNVIAPLRLTNDELTRIPELIGKAYSIYSDGDHIVPFDVLKKFPVIIGAKDCFIAGVGHMGSKSGLEELPEVVDIVKIIN